MQNRKQKNLQIERQKRRKSNIFKAVAVAVVAVIVLALAWSIWDVQNRRWIMTFEGERIATTDLEFMTTMYTMFMEPDAAKELAMRELLNGLTVMNRAEKHGISLDEDEWEDLIEQARGQQMWMQTEFISYERIAEILSMSALQEQLTDVYLADFVPDEEELAAELEMYIAGNRINYARKELKHLTVPEVNDAIRILATEDEDFDDLVREYSMLYDAEVGVTTMAALGVIEMFGLNEEDADIILNMQEGERHMADIGGQFMVLYMDTRADADEAAMEESFREQFTLRQRSEAFNDLIQTWRDEMEYEINQRAYERL